MRCNEAGLSLIKEFEGLRLTPYLCPAGVQTVGYGHAIKPGEQFYKLTVEQAEDLLKRDVGDVERNLNRMLNVVVTDNQYAALVSFCFNLGTGAFRNSTMRALINRKDYSSASREFGKWVFGGGKALPGLVRRRAAEEALFVTPEGMVV